MGFLRKLLAAVLLAIIIVAVERWLHPLEPAIAATPPARDRGEILSVKGDASSVREAVVRLDDGQTVRASVPPACVVFAGQVARLKRQDTGGFSSSTYWIVEASDRRSDT